MLKIRSPNKLSLLLPFFLIMLLLSGCTASSRAVNPQEKKTGRYIKGVPFFAGDDYHCGPAALAGVLNFWGYSVSEEEIAGEIYAPAIKGTINVELASYARKKGFIARYYRGDMDSLQEEINAGHPLILFLDQGMSVFSAGHYILVLGYDSAREVVIAYSGKRRDVMIPYGELERTWKKTGYWTLLVAPGPPGQHSSPETAQRERISY